MPDLGEAVYLLSAFHEAGPAVDTAAGEEPLGWPVVWAFAQATEAVAEPWEMRLLIDMSKEYILARRKGEEPLARAPVDQAEEGE